MMYRLKNKATGKFLNWDLIEFKPTTKPIKINEVCEILFNDEIKTGIDDSNSKYKKKWIIFKV